MLMLFVFTLNFILLTFNLAFAGSTGASFLKIPIGARAISMGRAFTAVCDDVTAIHWNPAGLVQISKKEISATHTEWLLDTKIDFIGFAFPLNPKLFTLNPAVIAGSVIYLSDGDLEKRNETRQKTGTFTASDLAITASYSRNLELGTGNQVGLGINLKFISQQIESHQATGIAFDFGLLYKPNNFSIGFSIQNIGPQMKFISEPYNLPLTLTTGLGYKIGGLNLALDLKQKIYEGKTIVSIGTEYTPINFISLRTGYLLHLISPSTFTDFNRLSAGVGLKIFNIKTDYSFLPFTHLGETHQISFSVRF